MKTILKLTLTICLIAVMIVSVLFAFSHIVLFIAISPLFVLEYYLGYWNELVDTIKKSRNIDRTLKDKIDSKFSGKLAALEWSFVGVFVFFLLMIPFGGLIEQGLIRLEVLLVLIFLFVFYLYFSENIKNFLRKKIEASRPEIQLFFYLFFNKEVFFFISVPSFLWIYILSNLETLAGFRFYFFYLGYFAVITLIVLIVIRFVFSIVDDILNKIIEKEISALKKEEMNLVKKIKRIAEFSFDETDTERIQLNYWKKCVYESRLEIVHNEIKKIEWKYRQEHPIIRILIPFSVFVSLVGKLFVDFLEVFS
ncbi:MAG: hypothetical protein HXS48_00015 [Theionarchaea archaeon]|nr:hypothetical protein [Theionarchaea archaeon]